MWILNDLWPWWIFVTGSIKVLLVTNVVSHSQGSRKRSPNGVDLIWPLTLKTFSVPFTTYIMYICGKVLWNSSDTYRPVLRHMNFVNGRTDRRSDGRATQKHNVSTTYWRRHKIASYHYAAVCRLAVRIHQQVVKATHSTTVSLFVRYTIPPGMQFGILMALPCRATRQL